MELNHLPDAYKTPALTDELLVLASEVGLEPTSTVLETVVLATELL